jgi:hypothetical protein
MRELSDAPLHADVTDQEAWAYERMIERMLNEPWSAATGRCRGRFSV